MSGAKSKPLRNNKARMMINTLCPPWGPSTPPSLWLEGGGDPFQDLSSSHELQYATANLKMSSSPGPDYRMISHLPGCCGIILELFNQMNQERTYPTEWSQYEIFFIKKVDGVRLRPRPCVSVKC
jgi:hypothetical protein